MARTVLRVKAKLPHPPGDGLTTAETIAAPTAGVLTYAVAELEAHHIEVTPEGDELAVAVTIRAVEVVPDGDGQDLLTRLRDARLGTPPLGLQ